MKNAVLSFNGRVNIAYNQVMEKYEGATLLTAFGEARDGVTTDPSQIVNMKVAFGWASTKAIIIEETNYGVFGDPKEFDMPYSGAQEISWPLTMDLDKANELKEAAGYTRPYHSAGFIHPTYYEVEHPQFVFATGSTFVFVDTVTGNVSEEKIEDLVPNDRGLGITFNLKYEVQAGISRPARLVLEKAKTTWGEIHQKPPHEISTLPGHITSAVFSARGSFWGPAGTEGEVFYRGTDSDRTLFKVVWNISNLSDNIVSFTGGSSHYATSGGAFDPKSRSQIVNLEIKQVKE